MTPATILRLGLIFLLAVSPSLVRAERHEHSGTRSESGEDEDGRSRSGRESGRKEKGDSELEDVMEEMNGAFRKLRRQVDDKTQNASSIALAANLHQLAQRAMKSTPRLVAQAPEKDRAALLTAYREQMQELIATFADLQAALKTGKNAKAAEIVEDLRDLEKAGHHKFRAEDNH
jgi:soluble cytochrome b562